MSIEGVLLRQAGVIGRWQALAAGVSSSTISRRVESGAWIRVLPRVYLASDHGLTEASRLHMAVLWAGRDAVVSGVTAAWWLGLWPELPATVEVTVPLSRQLAAQPGILVRRRRLTESDVEEARGVRATSVPLTVLEAAVSLGDRGTRLLDRALQRRWVDLAALYQAYSRSLGRHGSAEAGRLLRASADQAASEVERLMIRLLREAGLSGWQCGYRVGAYEVDIAFTELKVAIEVDGWAWHSDVERFTHDRRRQNALVLAGWTILRFTWHDLTHRPATVITTIHTAINNRSAA